MSCEPFGQNQIDSEKIQWKDSIYRFTEPVRYFKSNDPYYWEVDNIPIKQLEENVLWLKEQLGSVNGPVELSGIVRKEFLELKPVSDGSTRKVQVLPGKFLARVNDAYQKGIGSITKSASTIGPGSDGFLEKRYKFNITTTMLTKIVGSFLGSPLYNTGLYDHLQHHSVSKVVGDTVFDWNNISTPALNTKVGIKNIPKNKLALWRQAATSTNFGDFASDLQQLSVDLTRAWGGTTRTALVNVQETLEIDIPPFSQSDYMNDTSYTPRVRFDLLFIYSHPADSASTTIAASNGESPTTITTPQLGIVKGAGVVKIKGQGLYTAYDSQGANSTSFFGSEVYNNNLSGEYNYFTSEDGKDDDNNYQIISPISDNNQTVFGAGGVFGNLPSPDDLMNLAPLLQEGLSDSFSLIGQSVLPIAYVIVREGQSAILSDDIIDIRPFFRTAELAYNERSGIAAANPPLSFANPAVGKHELSDSIKKSSNYVLSKVFALESLVGSLGDDDGGGGGGGGPAGGASTFITKGAVLGGTKYGVEGALLHLEAEWGASTEITNDLEAINILKARHLPGLTYIPVLPGWDIAEWCADSGLNDKGQKRNDRINHSVRAGGVFWRYSTDGLTRDYLDFKVDPVIDNNINPSIRIDNSNLGFPAAGVMDYDIVYYLKKRISLTLPANIKDYDVNCNFLSCIPATGSGKTPTGNGLSVHLNGGFGQTDLLDHDNPNLAGGPRSTENYGGIFVEKHGLTGEGESLMAEFTIFVPFAPGATNMMNELWNWQGLTWPGSTTASVGKPAHGSSPFSSDDADPDWEVKRESNYWSGFRVLSTLGDMGLHNNNWSRQTNPQVLNTNLGSIDPKSMPSMCVTYPTVEFSIIGYNRDFSTNYISDTETDEGSVPN